MKKARTDLDRAIEQAAEESGFASNDWLEEEAREDAADAAFAAEEHAILEEQAEIARDEAALERTARVTGRLLRQRDRIH